MTDWNRDLRPLWLFLWYRLWCLARTSATSKLKMETPGFSKNLSAFYQITCHKISEGRNLHGFKMVVDVIRRGLFGGKIPVFVQRYSRKLRKTLIMKPVSRPWIKLWTHISEFTRPQCWSWSISACSSVFETVYGDDIPVFDGNADEARWDSSQKSPREFGAFSFVVHIP
jgi:hypothetical protein